MTNTKNWWQAEYRNEANVAADHSCERCGGLTPGDGYGVIHHVQYSAPGGGSVYDHPYDYLHERGIVEWLCLDCHKYEHTARDYDEYKKGPYKKGGYCAKCGFHCFDGWSDVDKTCLCKHCRTGKCWYCGKRGKETIRRALRFDVEHPICGPCFNVKGHLHHVVQD